MVEVIYNGAGAVRISSKYLLTIIDVLRERYSIQQLPNTLSTGAKRC